jgi:hypothetical protein
LRSASAKISGGGKFVPSAPGNARLVRYLSEKDGEDRLLFALLPEFLRAHIRKGV